MTGEPRGCGVTIGEVARQAGCRVATIRYYEREGLMPPVPRTGGGHRVYRGEHVRRLVFIRRARQLGFTVDDVRDLLGLATADDPDSCANVLEMTKRHRRDVQRKMADLLRLDTALARLIDSCDGAPGRRCAILDTLFSAPLERHAGQRRRPRRPRAAI